MRKRTVALATSLVAVSLLAGCGKSQTTGSNNTDIEISTEETKIVAQMPSTETVTKSTSAETTTNQTEAVTEVLTEAEAETVVETEEVTETEAVVETEEPAYEEPAYQLPYLNKPMYTIIEEDDASGGTNMNIYVYAEDGIGTLADREGVGMQLVREAEDMLRAMGYDFIAYNQQMNLDRYADVDNGTRLVAYIKVQGRKMTIIN